MDILELPGKVIDPSYWITRTWLGLHGTGGIDTLAEFWVRRAQEGACERPVDPRDGSSRDSTIRHGYQIRHSTGAPWARLGYSCPVGNDTRCVGPRQRSAFEEIALGRSLNTNRYDFHAGLVVVFWAGLPSILLIEVRIIIEMVKTVAL